MPKKRGQTAPPSPILLDNNDLDVIFLTETPNHTRSGPLTHVLRNKGYHINHHPTNAQSPSDILPEARIPTQLTHPGGGCWLAKKKFSMIIHDSSSHPPAGLLESDHLRGGTHSPHRSKSGFHRMLPSATEVGPRTYGQGTRWSNHRTATPCPHPRRRPTGQLE